MRNRLSLLWLLLLLAVPSFSQDTASLSGTVRDRTGASIPQATVTVVSADRAITRELATNADGEFLAAGLPAGAYQLAITAKGFKRYEARNIVLRVAQKSRVDVDLEVGDTTTEITVQGEGLTAVETQSSDLAGTVTSKELSQLQLNGRNFTQLVTLVPGVSNQTGQDEGAVGIYGSVAYSINGGRTEYNNWELDGGDNMDNGSNTTLNVYPSLEAISEVRVLTSNYGAQYGRNASGTIEVETKSGTNQFHGSAYEFLRNDAFNAKNYFEDSVPAYKKHEFGYTIGGPVWKDKTFFFWSQAWRRERVPGQVFNRAVPSDANRAGDFSDLCPANGSAVDRDTYPDCPVDPGTGDYFANNIVPVDANAQLLMPLIPQATTTVDGVPTFIASPVSPTNWREELIRVDHNFNDKLRATFRYIHDSWDTVTPTTIWSTGDFPTIQTHFTGPGVSMVARLTATLSPTMLNEFVASYTTDHITLVNQGAWQRPAGMTIPGLFDNGFGGKQTGIQVNTNGAYSGGFGEDPGFVPQGAYNSNPTYTFRDNFIMSKGRHAITVGAYFVAAQKNELAFNDIQGFLTFDSGSANSTGNGFADMLMGIVDNFSQSNIQPKYYNRYKIFEPYVQDDWRVTTNLTLNLGLRVSMFGTYREKYKQEYNFEPTAWNAANAPVIGEDGNLVPGVGDPFNGMVQCGANGSAPGCQKGDLFNPAPRIGFAWDPFGDGKTSIRGAYGVFYEHMNGNEANVESLEGSPPLVLTPTIYNIVGYENVGGSGLLAPLGPVSVPDKAIWPYVQQWHLDIQHDIYKNTVATVSYVGSKGTHLTLQRDLNQLHAVAAADNPFLAGQPITQDICDTFVVNGSPVTGAALNNLEVACGADPNLLRPNYMGYGSITRIDPVANSNYNALQVSVRRTTGRLTLAGAYTYSHSIDNSSDRYDGNFVDSYNLRASRASSNFDQTHMLNISYVYDFPNWSGSKTMNAILGGWQLSGITSIQTGTPFSVINGGFGDSAGVANGLGSGSFADLVGDPNNVTSSGPLDAMEGPLLYNPDAYAEATGLTFGNSGRNSLRNPRRTNFDMALFKHIKPTERTNIEFRTEAFNIFNHTQWSAVDNTTGSDTFLRPNSAHRARTLQFGLKFSF